MPEEKKVFTEKDLHDLLKPLREAWNETIKLTKLVDLDKKREVKPVWRCL